jgi:hypothetical protein
MKKDFPPRFGHRIYSSDHVLLEELDEREAALKSFL